MRGLVFVVLAGVAGCGRIAFDPLSDAAGGGSGGSGSGDGDGGGSNGDDAPGACPVVPDCPDQTLPINTTFTTMSSQAITRNHGLASGMCGSGNGSPEFVWMLVPQAAATYSITATPTPLAMYIQDLCCGGVELACGAGGFDLEREVNQRFVVVIEGLSGDSYNLQVSGN